MFLIVTIPWHLFMTIKFGAVFWKDYFGFHIWDRFSQTILPFPWEGNNRWGYMKLFWLRSGIWFLVFLASSLFLIWEYFWNIKNEYTKDRKAWIFLYVWLAVVFFPFFFSVTKLPNYMVLSYFPMALIVGGSLNYFWKKIDIKILFALSILSLLNFLPILRLRVSDFGEAHVFLPKIFIRYAGLDDTKLILLMLVLIITVSIIFLKFHEKTAFLKKTFFLIFMSMNILVPFTPQRNEFIKQFAVDLSQIAENKPVKLYVIMKPDHFSFQCVGAYYLPLGSRVENLGQRKMTILPSEKRNDLSFCFVDRGLESEEMKKQEVLSYDQGIVFDCEVEK
jgi:hypothetical protein